VDFSPTTKDLATQGFPLAGGRLDHVDNRTVAALAYHRALHPINLFTWPAKNSREIPPQALSRRGYHLIYWTSGGMVYWVISDLNERELQNFVELIRSL
jgi:anti-sigma factor RsiW